MNFRGAAVLLAFAVLLTAFLASWAFPRLAPDPLVFAPVPDAHVWVAGVPQSSTRVLRNASSDLLVATTEDFETETFGVRYGVPVALSVPASSLRWDGATARIRPDSALAVGNSPSVFAWRVAGSLPRPKEGPVPQWDDRTVTLVAESGEVTRIEYPPEPEPEPPS